MVDKRMKPRAALQLIRKHAKQRNLTVAEIPGRGKGSHQMYMIHDTQGSEVGRFTLTQHGSKDMSWTVLRSVEDGLAHLFGDKWMETR